MSGWCKSCKQDTWDLPKILEEYILVVVQEGDSFTLIRWRESDKERKLIERLVGSSDLDQGVESAVYEEWARMNSPKYPSALQFSTHTLSRPVLVHRFDLLETMEKGDWEDWTLGFKKWERRRKEWG